MDKMDVFGNLSVHRRTEYVLKKKDENLLHFSVILGPLGTVSCVIEDVILNDASKLPYGLTLDNDSLLLWLERRFIPKNRTFVDKILSALSELDPHLVNLLNTTLGLSLTDDYWVLRDSNSDLLWSNHNLYDNEFSETLALIAFTGYDHKVKGIASSPEFTTNGMLPKCWRRIDGKVVLFKGGTTGAANAGLEPYSEFYAYQVAEAMGLSHVKYNMEKWKGILCSTCELFTSKDISFIPAHVAFPGFDAIRLLSHFRNTIIYTKLVDLLIFDAVIANNDRHFGNFGFLRDNNTGELVDLAPIFDNGMSLLHQSMDSDLDNIDSYLNWRKFTFAFIPNNSLMELSDFMSTENKSKLRKLLDFEFRKHDKYNVSDYRLKFLSEFVNLRAKDLLK